MRYKDLEARRGRVLSSRLNYTYCYYLEWDYSILRECLTRRRNGSKSNTSYAEAWIMLDTETSRSEPLSKGYFGRYNDSVNYVVAFTCSIRMFEKNICTLRGSRPSEAMHMLKLIRKELPGTKFYVWVHNLGYDWQFLRRFFFREFGEPKKQLNIKSHYPMLIEFECGLVLRDSYILAGVSLDRWAKNMGVQTQKALGCWDYDLIRHQNRRYTDEELLYIEHDTLAGVECLNALANRLKNTVVDIPFTNTGIVRRHVQVIGRKNYAKQEFNKQLITFEELDIMHSVFHGGFTHANRHIVGWIIDKVKTKCKDFKSSYPFCMLCFPVPRAKFVELKGEIKDPAEIYKKSDQNAYIFKFVARKIHLKDPMYPMPVLQASKCEVTINDLRDNGRIREADYVEIWLNEVDLKLIYELYDWKEAYCVDIRIAHKDLMPKWFRDVVWEIFKEKCELEVECKIKKTGDMSLYNLKKGQLNSLYGMSVTFPIRPDIVEAYKPEEWKGQIIENGDYYEDKIDMEKKFEKYLKDWRQVLPYIYGVYVTSWAQYNLFQLSKCIKDINFHWLYSDTDSIYSDNWDEDMLAAYNENCKQLLKKAGYGSVVIEGHEFWLGIAETDGVYDKFITQGAKRYAVEKDGKIKITVAGVPKSSGAGCLKDLSEFREDFVFKGEITGKKISKYFYQDITENKYGDEISDYIDMTPGDYRLSVVPNDQENLLENMIFNDEMELVQMQFYEEKE